MSAPVRVRPAEAGDAGAVGELARRASEQAQSPALNEATLLSLGAEHGPADPAPGDPAHGGPTPGDPVPGDPAHGESAHGGPTVLLAMAGGEPVGALAVHQQDDPITAELVLPDGPHRDGAGDALLDELARIAAGRREVPTRLWVHGRGSPVGPLAQRRGYAQQRVLARLVRPGDLPAPAAPIPPGVRIAPFRPGIDDEAWLAVNAAAFADHPEQGRWTGRDLRDRLEAEWFDADGFLLGWLDPLAPSAGAAADPSAAAAPGAGEAGGPGGLVGFHWTKTEPDPRYPGTESGEVYVIGVWPGAAGLHLGSALLSAGLEHLRARGTARVYLYVDGDNDRARSLYEHVGFVEDDVDICYDIA
ncbi:MAG: mycothiol synthase [Frankiaceae bacterium]|jgi:mycothiol synthase|nr:mycothiol synthase [Frankiaceae bacterium]